MCKNFCIWFFVSIDEECVGIRKFLNMVLIWLKFIECLFIILFGFSILNCISFMFCKGVGDLDVKVIFLF